MTGAEVVERWVEEAGVELGEDDLALLERLIDDALSHEPLTEEDT